MKRMKQVREVSRDRAIEIAANHNNVSKEVASRYTDSELQEVLRQVAPSHLTLKLKK